MRKYKILVVDDDPIVRVQVRGWLEAMGHEVKEHHQGIGTMDAILQHDPDIVLLDLNLPNLRGEQLASLVQKKNKSGKETGVIFYSSKDRAELDALVTQTRVWGAIEKTGSGTQFKAALTDILRDAGASKPGRS